MKKLNLIIPMGGSGTRFGNHGFKLPKPLIEIYGKPFFFWATRSIEKFVKVNSLTFVVLKEHVDKFNIDKSILKYFPLAKINIIENVLPGAVLTCMQGIRNINDNEPILFNDCDHLFLCSKFYEFCMMTGDNNVDGALLTFKSKDPRFSYVSFDTDGLVNRTVEKKSISDEAICGAYYFRDKSMFENSVNRYLDNCKYSEYFVSGVYNIMVEDKMKIKTFITDEHVSFGTPEEFELAKDSNVYRNLL